ncbi:MAG TPA: DUF2254 family protein, partial [Trueperaceae bacterium]
PAPRNGYLQALDEEGLFDLACQHDLLLELRHRPGDFVMTGSTLLRVRGRQVPGEGLRSALLGKFAFGARRMSLQDLDFLFDQLVEVALRALSPAINDPFTAKMCADRIGDGLALLGRVELPSGRRYDEAGTLRIIAPTLDLPALAEACLGPLRRHASNSLQLYLHLTRTIGGVLALADEPGLRRVLLRELRLLEATGTERLRPEDGQQLTAAYRQVLAAANAAEGP